MLDASPRQRYRPTFHQGSPTIRRWPLILVSGESHFRKQNVFDHGNISDNKPINLNKLGIQWVNLTINDILVTKKLLKRELLQYVEISPRPTQPTVQHTFAVIPPVSESQANCSIHTVTQLFSRGS